MARRAVRGRDRHVAVGGAERLHRIHYRVTRAETLRHLAQGKIAHQRVLQYRRLTVQHRHVYPLAFARAIALDHCREHGDRREERGRDVSHADAGPHGPTAWLARDTQYPAHGLHDHVERGSARQGPGLSKPGDGGHDHARVADLQHVVAHAETIHDSKEAIIGLSDLNTDGRDTVPICSRLYLRSVQSRLQSAEAITELRR